MLKAVYTTKNRRKKEKLVNVIKSGLSDLKNEIKDKIVDIVEKVLEFNRQNQEGQGLQRPDSNTSKTSTPDQMIRRLPITLAQLKAGNNSEKTLKWNKTTIVFFVLFKKINKNNL